MENGNVIESDNQTIINLIEIDPFSFQLLIYRYTRLESYAICVCLIMELICSVFNPLNWFRYSIIKFSYTNLSLPISLISWYCKNKRFKCVSKSGMLIFVLYLIFTFYFAFSYSWRDVLISIFPLLFILKFLHRWHLSLWTDYHFLLYFRRFYSFILVTCVFYLHSNIY